MKTTLMLASAVLLISGAVTAQTATPQAAIPADQTPVATVTPVQPETAAPPVAISPAPGAVAAADGPVTKEGGKYVKDGRPATRMEIASYKKASKAKRE